MCFKSKKPGAEIIAGPHDVMDAGRILMIKDPVGATIALWQGSAHKGCKRVEELNTPYWYELATRDTKVSKDFYCFLLGWQSETKPMDNMQYTLFLVNGKPIAGMLEMTNEWPVDIPPHWMIYFAVENCNTAIKKVKELGGQVLSAILKVLYFR